MCRYRVALASRTAPFPAVALRSSVSTTRDRNPVARVIGVSSWAAAPQDFEMARAAPADTNATYGGCSRSRPVISVSAAPSGEAIILVVVCRRNSVLTLTGWLSPKARAGAHN